MKNYFILVLLCQIVILHAQLGVGTEQPQTELDVNGDVTLREELRLGGTSTTTGDAGQYGQVLFSQEESHQPIWKFVNVPFLEEGQIQLKYSYAVEDLTGVQFPSGTGDNNDTSVLGENLNSSWMLI